MFQISTSEKCSLKTIGSSSPDLHIIECQASRCALVTCTNEAIIGSETGGDDEFTADNYSSDDSGKPSVDTQLFQQSNNQPQTSAAARRLDPMFNISSYMRPWESLGTLSPRTTRRSMLRAELTDSQIGTRAGKAAGGIYRRKRIEPPAHIA
ncbi:hypothetical protein HRG_000742 [Hirsutella rhossiliensis]|uniref:Uncharacterized protein n=1 Tax=Hirsutella rhossiliensis TaxID=111463 RepID=A0A9P8N6Z6_9HYPO|nr:uncharacterized protein HRG_00742 [Hirsutella rhossiliensis]KAH0968100.1 hypothetical protein HRG_00742 [Hirsutella rhossiliensis]